MYNLRNKYKISTIIVSCIICLIVVYLNLLSHEKTQKIYLEQTENVIIDLKKDFLKDTVNNVILEIDNLRKAKYSNYQKNTDSRLKRFQEGLDLPEDKFIENFISRFKEDVNTKMWTAFLWNKESGEILYATPDVNIESTESAIKHIDLLLSSHAVIEKGNIQGIFGTSKTYIDELVKSEIDNFIKNRKFSNDSYIWVNEVINYEGGKDYAIRRVHPNLVDTEGMYLSTDMEDIKGNLPYLEELEGINKYGELFFTYYFKDLNTPEISEKVTYAKLYKDYDWIIAMGVHLDDIISYTENTNNEIQSLSSIAIMRLVSYICVVLLIGFIILSIIDRRRLLTSTKHLEQVISVDNLTKSYSRNYGEANLDLYFKRYKSTGEKSAIMMFDIDGFKDVNDKYGHKAGDTVLIEIVKAINIIIRSSDHLIRWGGDEFVVILPGLREENVIEFGKKFLEKISSLDIELEDQVINITISIGFSYFNDSDTSYSDVLKRADDAMYTSKKQGKNKANVLL